MLVITWFTHSWFVIEESDCSFRDSLRNLAEVDARLDLERGMYE